MMGAALVTSAEVSIYSIDPIYLNISNIFGIYTAQGSFDLLHLFMHLDILCTIFYGLNNILLQSTGTYFAAARLAGATPPPASVISQSIGLQVLQILMLLLPPSPHPYDVSINALIELKRNPYQTKKETLYC